MMVKRRGKMVNRRKHPPCVVKWEAKEVVNKRATMTKREVSTRLLVLKRESFSRKSGGRLLGSYKVVQG